jgi:hypothetical protein
MNSKGVLYFLYAYYMGIEICAIKPTTRSPAQIA